MCSILWVGKILWRREWQSTPVFLPGELHGQRSHGVGYSLCGLELQTVGYSPWGRKELDATEQLTQQQHNNKYYRVK